MVIVQKFSKIVYKNNKSHSGSVIQTSAMFENKLIGKKRLCCNAGCQEIGRCRTRGESDESIALRHRSTLTVKPGETLPESSKQGPMSSIS